MFEQHVDAGAGWRENPGRAPSDGGFTDRLKRRNVQDFAREERAGLELATKIRPGILAVAVTWLAGSRPSVRHFIAVHGLHGRTQKCVESSIPAS